MSMDKNAIAGNVVTAIITAAALGILGFIFGVFEKGADAITTDQIQTVLEETLVLDDGRTYGKALSEISTVQATTLTEINEIKNELDDLEDAVLELAQ